VTLLTDYLVEAGCHVSSTTDGTQAVSLAVKENVHLIILGLILPGVDGWQVLHELR